MHICVLAILDPTLCKYSIILLSLEMDNITVWKFREKKIAVINAGHQNFRDYNVYKFRSCVSDQFFLTRLIGWR